MSYTFDFSVIWNNIGLFAAGAFVTIRLSLIAIAFGLIIGIVGALLKTSGNQYFSIIQKKREPKNLYRRFCTKFLIKFEPYISALATPKYI